MEQKEHNQDNATLVGKGRTPLIVQFVVLGVSLPFLLVLEASNWFAFLFGFGVTAVCVVDGIRRISASRARP